MKKNFIIGAALGVVLVLTGCAAENTTSAGGGTYVQVVQMPDDTSVDCVIRGYTMSCDWERRS